MLTKHASFVIGIVYDNNKIVVVNAKLNALEWNGINATNLVVLFGLSLFLLKYSNNMNIYTPSPLLNIPQMTQSTCQLFFVTIGITMIQQLQEIEYLPKKIRSLGSNVNSPVSDKRCLKRNVYCVVYSVKNFHWGKSQSYDDDYYVRRLKHGNDIGLEKQFTTAFKYNYPVTVRTLHKYYKSILTSSETGQIICNQRYANRGQHLSSKASI